MLWSGIEPLTQGFSVQCSTIELPERVYTLKDSNL